MNFGISLSDIGLHVNQKREKRKEDYRININSYIQNLAG